MDKRKILIISHNPISTSDNMGKTIGNIFNRFLKNEICQLYFHNEIPNYNICDNYFYINEQAIFKSIFKKVQTGNAIQDTTQNNKINQSSCFKHNDIINRIYQYGRRKTDFVYCMRNLIWKLSKWNSDDLNQWLEEQNPSCIFFFAGDYLFLFDIVLNLSKKLNIPIFSYYVDEFYFTKKNKQKLGIDAYFYRKKFKELFLKSKMNFCISELMQKEYQNCFMCDVETLMNTSEKKYQNKYFDNNVLYMRYIGNISHNRWKVLSVLSTAIETLNKKNKKQIIFEIYSGESNKNLLNTFLSNNAINFKGKISSEEVNEKINDSDILVHVESFESDSIESVRYSISTKIPDLLSSNRLILAIGPDNVESINYIHRNNSGLVINTDREDILLEKLQCLYDDINFSSYINCASSLYKKNHLPQEIENKLKKYL